MKKGQIGFVSFLLVLVLLILIVLAFGYFYSESSNDDTWSVYKTKISGSMESRSVTVNENQYDVNDCCGKNTFINYGWPQEPVREVVFLDNYYHVPDCNDCGPKVWIGDVPQMPPQDVIYLDNFYHAPCCNC